MDAKVIGANIRRRRKEMGLSLSELARRAGVDKGNLSKLERGELGTSIPSLAKIARELQTTESVLLQESGNLGKVSVHTQSIPIVRWAEIGDLGPRRDLSMYDTAAFNIEFTADVYALRIENDSMSPKFRIGDLIAVDTKGKPRPGCYVVAQIGDEKFLRRYRELGRTKTGAPSLSLCP